MVQVVADYNANEDVHGILVQLPLPKHINEQRILDAISLEKDVDGFHPANIGALAMRGRTPLFTSCTPKVVDRSDPSLLPTMSPVAWQCQSTLMKFTSCRDYVCRTYRDALHDGIRASKFLRI